MTGGRPASRTASTGAAPYGSTSWLAIDGLRRHRRDDVARTLARQRLDLVRERGFWEYYDPETREGLGSEECSWTAALVLDLLATHEEL